VPTYGTTSKGGFDFSLPYYLNIAPNYDATIQPRYFSKRGLQLGGEFRYLGWGYNGSVYGAYLPNDNVSGENRWMYWWRHQQLLSNGFYADWDVAKVSDNDYFRDISQLGLNQASTTYLPQRARVGWASNYWSAYAQVYKYQTLQDPNALLTPPYDKEPELFLRGARYGLGRFRRRMDLDRRSLQPAAVAGQAQWSQWRSSADVSDGVVPDCTSGLVRGAQGGRQLHPVPDQLV